MAVPVASVTLAEDGVWEADLPEMHTSRDIITVESTSSFQTVRAPVRAGDSHSELTIYLADAKNGYVTLEDLGRVLPESPPG